MSGKVTRKRVVLREVPTGLESEVWPLVQVSTSIQFCFPSSSVCQTEREGSLACEHVSTLGHYSTYVIVRYSTIVHYDYSA